MIKLPLPTGTESITYTTEKMQTAFYITLVRIQPKPNGLGYLSTYSQLKSLGRVMSIAQERAVSSSRCNRNWF